MVSFVTKLCFCCAGVPRRERCPVIPNFRCASVLQIRIIIQSVFLGLPYGGEYSRISGNTRSHRIEQERFTYWISGIPPSYTSLSIEPDLGARIQKNL